MKTSLGVDPVPWLLRAAALLLLSSAALAGAPSPLPTGTPGLLLPPALLQASAPDKDFATKTFDLEVGAPLRFVVCSDVHENMPRLKQAVSAIEALAPQFVVFLGDLTDRSEPERVALAVREFARLRVPFLPVLGNHERLDGRYASYRARFGPPNYAFRAGDALFVVADSSRGTLAAPVVRWLDATLAAGQTLQRRFVFTHVPPHDPRPEEAYALDPSSARKLLELSTRRGVDTVFSGHIHRASEETVDGVRYVTGGVVGGRLYDLPACGGYYHLLLVEADARGSRVTRVPFGPQPTSLDVWAGDLKMLRLHRTRLEAAVPGSKDSVRLERRLEMLERKFERYRQLVADELRQAPSAPAWLAAAEQRLARQPRWLADELEVQLKAVRSLAASDAPAPR